MSETKPEYRFFTDADMDRIDDISFMTPIFDDVIARYDFQKVLDYGCGNGIFGIYFKERHGCYLAGVDGSAYGLEQAKNAGMTQPRRSVIFVRRNCPLKMGPLTS